MLAFSAVCQVGHHARLFCVSFYAKRTLEGLSPLPVLRRPVCIGVRGEGGYPVFKRVILILVVDLSTDITDDNQGVGVRFSLESGGRGEKRRSSRDIGGGG